MSFLLYILLLSNFWNDSNSIKKVDYDFEINNLIQDFNKNILIGIDPLIYKKRATSIHDNIVFKLSDNSLNSEERIKLENHKKEAIAVANFITTITGLDGLNASIEEFNHCLIRFGGEKKVIRNDKSGLVILRTKINDFVSFVSCNNTDFSLMVDYKWKSLSTSKSGTISNGLFPKSTNRIINNRLDLSLSNINIYSVKITQL